MDFQYFISCLEEATELIKGHYFKAEIYGSDAQIIRERVYCYELYHRLRNVLGDDFQYELNGELDKTNHPLIFKNIGAKKPDFVVHVPGDRNRNLVVIEVKPISTRYDRLRDDLKTIMLFLNKAKYYRGIVLIYGNDKSNSIDRIKKELRTFPKEKLLLIWHKDPLKKSLIVNI